MSSIEHYIQVVYAKKFGYGVQRLLMLDIWLRVEAKSEVHFIHRKVNPK